MAAQFENLIVFQKARQLSKRIHEMTTYPNFQNDRDLANQLRRAAVSVVSNIAEGFERASPKEFAHFLNIAKASCGEIRAQLYLVQDIGIPTCEDLDKLRSELIGLSKQIFRLREHLLEEKRWSVEDEPSLYNRASKITSK
jgi:four helix bundle protein